MNDKARIGVIGAGWWAVVNHIPVLKGLPDCEVVAVNRLGAEELQAVVESTEAVGPFRSRPWAAPAPSASGQSALRPSGVAPVWEPSLSCMIQQKKPGT